MGDRHPILEPGADTRRTRRCDATRPVADRALLERDLQRRNTVDRDVLVERFLPLARGLARRYQRTGEPFDDLFQVACLGLVKAIDRFDLNRDVAFSTYAVPTMVGEIRRYLRDRTWSVRVPRGLQELALRAETNIVELSSALHRQPTVADIARTAAATEEQVLEALQAAAARRRCRPRAPARTGPARRSATPSPAPSTASAWPRTAPRWTSCCARSPRASARCCACTSRTTSPSERSANASASRRCRPHASSAARSPACAQPHALEKLLGRRTPQVPHQRHRTGQPSRTQPAGGATLPRSRAWPS
jgi:RNA polymerase sigma factor (sigma-70 family)